MRKGRNRGIKVLESIKKPQDSELPAVHKYGAREET